MILITIAICFVIAIQMSIYATTMLHLFLASAFICVTVCFFRL